MQKQIALLCICIYNRYLAKRPGFSLLGTMRLSCSCVISRSCLCRLQVSTMYLYPRWYRYLVLANAEIVDQHF